jgi:hypothetical protein
MEPWRTPRRCNRARYASNMASLADARWLRGVIEDASRSFATPIDVGVDGSLTMGTTAR